MLNNVYLVIYGTNYDIRGTKYSHLPLINLKDDPDYVFRPGVRYLVMWNDRAKDNTEQPYHIIIKKIHLGPRSENHYDITKMDYVLTRSGIIFKFIYCRYETKGEWIDKGLYENMVRNLSSIAKKVRNPRPKEIWSEKKQKYYYRFEFDVVKDPSGDIEGFIEDPDYIKDYPKISYYKIIRSSEDINNSFDYFMNKDQMYGFDYETNGFPFDDPEFFHMGLGIAGEDGIAAYYDLEYIQTLGNNFDLFKKRLLQFCDKYEKQIITYNVGFEMRATYLLLYKLYTFNDAATVNKMEGLVHKRFSLKYTAMKELHTSSWDDSFESLNELLPQLFGWNYDKEDYDWSYEHKFITVTEYDETGSSIEVTKDIYYKNNPVWKQIADEYPEELEEFDRLFSLYWGYPFKCIPSNILGKYCCWDAFNTVQLKVSCLTKYSEKAWNYLDDNMILGALLDINGQFIDTEELDKQYYTSYHIVAYGHLVSVIFKLNYDRSILTGCENIEIPEIVNSLRSGLDPFDVKTVMFNALDETWDKGVNDNLLLKSYGYDFVERIHDYIDTYCNGKLTEEYRRSRKIFNEITEDLYERYSPVFNDTSCEFTINGEVYKVDRSYDELRRYYKLTSDLDYYNHLLKQMKLEEPVEYLIDMNGVKVSTPDIIEMCSASFNINSPQMDPYFKFSVYNWFRPVVRKSLVMMHRYEDEGIEDIEQYTLDGNLDVNTINVTEEDMRYLRKFENALILTEDKCYALVEKYKETIEERINCYPSLCVEINKLKNTEGYQDDPKLIARVKYLTMRKDQVEKLTEEYRYFKATDDVFTFVWNSLDYGVYEEATGKYDKNGTPEYVKTKEAESIQAAIDDAFHYPMKTMLQFLPLYPLDDEKGREMLFYHTDEIDATGKSIYAFGKLGFAWFAAKKYGKVASTYISGQFSSFNWGAKDYDDNWVITERWYDIDKAKEPGYHVQSYSRFNVCEKQSKRWSAGSHTIPSKSQTKRIWTSPKGALCSYFDISGAEVRAISYLSQDKFMMHNYDLGLDPYIEFSKLTDPDMTEEQHRARRPVFKQLLLGNIYGMGNDLLAENINKTPEEAAALQESLFSKLTGVKAMIDQKGQYCNDHQGLCDSILGDTLEMEYEPDRWLRLGINQVIQSFAAVSLAQGFFHCTDVSLHTDEIKVRPFNVVHDSCQNYFETTKLFDIFPYYHKNLTDYLNDLYGVKYEFDLEVGANYYDMVDLSQIDENHLKLTANYEAMSKLLKKCREDGLLFHIDKFVNKKKDLELETDGYNDPVSGFEPKNIKSIPELFFEKQGYANFTLDKSKYEVIISRI